MPCAPFVDIGRHRAMGLEQDAETVCAGILTRLLGASSTEP
jgi:hypothetical protein